jgi:hypothetical protein
MSPRTEVCYVYGVVPATLALGPTPEGLDDRSVEIIAEGGLSALVSRIDGEAYAPAAVERATEDVEWLAPRAVAHDRVLTWASDHGPIVPLPIFSLFSDAEAVRAMLRDRRQQLDAALERTSGGREYALRVYRIDAELSTVAAELSPRLAELEAAAKAATPGQRYLLERKLKNERKNELHIIGGNIAREVMERLRPLAVEAVEGRIVPRASRAGADPSLILDAAFLVSASGLESFQRALTDIVTRHASRGLRFDFTGPWPPYHFLHNSEERLGDDA